MIIVTTKDFKSEKQRDKHDSIDIEFFHRSSFCDNVWVDFKSMHGFFVEIMLSQILFLLGCAKLELFSLFSQSLRQNFFGVNIKFI